MNIIQPNIVSAAAPQTHPLSRDYIEGWLAGHRAQAGRLVAAAARAPENISNGSPVQEQFDSLCRIIFRAWTRDGHREG